MRADDRVRWTHHDLWIAVDRPRAFLQLAREAIVHAPELGLARLTQIQIGEESP
jgi:hypothetical protein